MGRLLLASACVLAAMAAPSCRGLVFEDRTPCPSWVTVVLRNPVPGTEGAGAVLHLWKDGAVTSCGAHTQEEFSQGVTTAIHSSSWPWALNSSPAGVDCARSTMRPLGAAAASQIACWVWLSLI